MQIVSMQSRCTPEEWQARIDLAACYRLVDLYGMSDMMANHISSHVPGESGAFLINPYGMMYEEITASSLIKVNLAGEILAKPAYGELDYGINRAGYVIHSAIHAERPEVACIIHTHAWASMAVSALECGLLPVTQTAMRFLKVRYHDYQGVVLDDAIGPAKHPQPRDVTTQRTMPARLGIWSSISSESTRTNSCCRCWQRSMMLPASSPQPGPISRTRFC